MADNQPVGLTGVPPLALKKTCDTCTKSKVKCSGGYPCTRCANKGIQCFYSPRKKRGAPKKEPKNPQHPSPIVVKAEVQTVVKGTLSSLADHERRSWSVFFTLYKHYGTSCSLFWFNRQLKKMQEYLKQRGDTAALQRLTTWMEAINVDMDMLTAKMDQCKLRIMSKAVIHPPGSVSLVGIQGEVKDPEREQLERLQLLIDSKKNSKTPFIRVKTKFLESKQEGVEIYCNEAFTLVFGHTAENLEKELNWTGGGLLPWGGDVIGRIIAKESDLLAFVQILAIKFNAAGPPKKIPAVREIPSCHMMDVYIKDEAANGKKVTSQALIKCVHRETLKLEDSSLEVSIDITPLSPTDHLLDPQKITSQVLLAREADTFTTKRSANDLDLDDSLDIQTVNASDQAEFKKVRGTYAQAQEPPAVSSEDVQILEMPNSEEFKEDLNAESQFDINIEDITGEPQVLKASVNANKASGDIGKRLKSVSMSQLEEFIDGNIDEATQEEYLRFDNEDEQELDDALDTYAGEEAEVGMDDWFENLLDWSKETTVPKQWRPQTIIANGIPDALKKEDSDTPVVP